MKNISNLLKKLKLLGSLLRSGENWIVFFLLISIIAFEITTRFLHSQVLLNTADLKYNFGGPNLEEIYTTSDLLKPANNVNDNQINNEFMFDNSALAENGTPLLGIIYLGEGSLKYKIKKGDTLNSVANQFQVTTSSLIALNGSKKFIPGTWIIINKNFEQNTNLAQNLNNLKNLPNLKNYFSLPTQGWNWGILHNYNAVDIANQCGTPVFAAADGIVISDQRLGSGSSGWNYGYGLFVLLEHPNGTKTRYAHLDKILVKLGDLVKKGQEIGLMGNTGDTKGPTGCHLHFEVYGAQNPFALY